MAELSLRFQLCLLVFFLPLINMQQDKDEMPSFYNEDDTDGFLDLCSGCKNCSEVKDCGDKCQKAVRRSFADKYDEKDNPCEEKHFAGLRKGQKTVKKFRNKLNSYFESIILWVLFLPCVFLGTYLISVGHFDWKTLPIIGSPYHPDPTHGIAYWQYHRMKYVIFKNEVKKREEETDVGATNYHPASFIYDTVSNKSGSTATDDEYTDEEEQ